MFFSKVFSADPSWFKHEIPLEKHILVFQKMEFMCAPGSPLFTICTCYFSENCIYLSFIYFSSAFLRNSLYNKAEVSIDLPTLRVKCFTIHSFSLLSGI